MANWEKKTAQRAQLSEAAADTFNEMITPGQSLLKTLQESEIVRKDKYFSTVGAKMKAAREKLPSLGVKHAVRSDLSIFTTPPTAEVHSLLPHVKPEQANMEGVQTMLEAKLEAHRSVWDDFVAVRDGARARLEAVVAAAANDLRTALAEDDAEVEEVMAALGEDRVMNLTEPEVHEVWDAVAQRIPERARWIEELAAGLEAAEEERRRQVEGQLVEMVRGMSEAAALSEGEVERVLEREALALNTAILTNRRAYADLVRRLQVAEVGAEKSRRARWEEALRAWRTLRSKHAIELFKQRIRSAEFSEPSERLALFEAVREWQGAMAARAARHVESMPQLLPPHMTLRRVAGWRDEGGRLYEAWVKEAAAWHDKLRAHDDEALEARGWEAYQQLLLEVLAYKGYPEAEARELVDSECGSVLRERRAAALEVITQARKFLEWQALRWHQFISSLGSWLSHLATLFEEHKAATGTNEGSVRSVLKAQRENFNAEDASLEAALEEAIEAVREGASERELDEQVSLALARLDDIEAHYRSFHGAMSAIVRSFPRTVAEANDKYQWDLCTSLLIKPLVPPITPPAQDPPPPPPEPQPPAPAQPPAAAAGKGKAAAAAAAVVEPPPPTPPPPPPEPEPIRLLVLPDGSRFSVMKDLVQVLRQQADAKALEEEQADAAATAPTPPAQPEEPPPPPPPEPKAKGKDAKKPAADKKGAAAAAAAPPEPEAPPPPPPPPPEPRTETSPVSSAGKPYCKELALPEPRFREVLEQVQVGLLKEMVEFAARTVSTAEEWAEERETLLTEELDAHLRAHRPRAGRIEEETRLARSVELVAQRRKIEGHLRAQSKAVKAQASQFLEWMAGLESETRRKIARLHSYDAFLGQALSAKGIDIRKREAEALRARIEREMTAKLSELQDQVGSSCQRIIDANAAFDSAELRTFADGGHYSPDNVAVYRASLMAIDTHMGGTRESQLASLRSLQDRLTQEADSALSYIFSLLPSHHEDMALIEKLDELLEAARRKARTELARNAEASAAIAAELDRLDTLLASVHKSAQQQHGRLHHTASQSSRTPATSEAGVRVAGPTSHHGTERSPGGGHSLSGAPIQSRDEGRSTGGGGAPRVSMSDGAPLRHANSLNLGDRAGHLGRHTSTSGSSAAGGGGAQGALAQCTTIVESMDKLRSMLYRQAKALDFLRSTGLVIEPMDLTLDAAEDPGDRDGGTAGGAGGAGGRGSGRLGGGVAFRPGSKDSGSAGGAAPGTTGAGAGKGGAGGKAGAAGGAGAASKPGTPPGGQGSTQGDVMEQVVTLAADIEAVIDACKRDTDASAQAYYAALYPDPPKGGAGGGAKAAAGKPGAKPSTPPKSPVATPKGGKGARVSAVLEPEGPQPVRPIRYPARIPPSLEALLSATDSVLEGLREQLRDHVAAGVKELRAQVIRAYRLVEHAPAVAMAALTQHELQAARAGQSSVRAQYRGQHARLLAQVEEERRSLHPTMAQPTGRSKLEALKRAEGERASSFTQLLDKYAADGVKGIEAQGPVIRQRLVHLVTVMVRLLDNFMMPDDLPPIREDGTDDWVYALPGRKDDKQLFRLALANAEAEGMPAAQDPKAGAGGGAGKPGAAAGKPDPKKPPSAKGAKPAAGAPGSGGEVSGEVAGRPFGALSWTLPGGNFDLTSLGWANDPASGLPQVTAEPTPTEAAAAGAPGKAGAKPGGKPDPKSAAGAKGAAAGKAGAKDAGAAAGAGAAVTAAPGTVIISGMDTPCHRAGIRAYRASLQQVEETLRAALQGLAAEMKTWVVDEALWQRTWRELLAQLEGL